MFVGNHIRGGTIHVTGTKYEHTAARPCCKPGFLESGDSSTAESCEAVTTSVVIIAVSTLLDLEILGSENRLRDCTFFEFVIDGVLMNRQGDSIL